MNCNNIKKIEIPNNVKVIEKQAFYKCKKLEKVKLGNNVQTIGNSAFQTTNIKNVKIPNSVKKQWEWQHLIAIKQKSMWKFREILL